ncbi:MAG: 4-hydroxythreonine-4-phosphate dehydrogenase PdxA [Synergistetes bacterium]|nr:4-hydroxythreonine-4-phosphate dehydrogenase PdxA [Synergistota bacterium]MCX8128303.1 4-hydroxythreonine-4-phosphate dehydrogenase PdxA [Synergistota bacterium]MDW8192622.1 4-hydroxythreonine-4-phosphate dehydrogenase PdxA [Synergistota bacterium]
MSELPVVGITMGDAAGIGPEIIVKALAKREIWETCKPLIIGDFHIMEQNLKFWPKDSEIKDPKLILISSPEYASWEVGKINIIQPIPSLKGIEPGKLSLEAGRGAALYVKAGAELAKKGLIHAIATAPLNKEAINKAGFNYPGHTELLASEFGIERYSLVLTARDIFIFHVTTHVSLREAIDLINIERILNQIRLAHLFSKALGYDKEKIAVSALNPHAGEGGLFGREEIEIIEPAVKIAQSEGINAIGPLPGDALFPAATKGKYRFLIAMYHDQGHIFFKSLFFDEGVNITVGLPILRTSVDHGTAFDIAGLGIANESSMAQAIKLAAKLGPKWKEIYKNLEI